MSSRLYLETTCGYRSIKKILYVLNDLLDWHLPSIPSANTISSWIHKSGYKVYQEPLFENQKEYALIFDESMMVGSERLLLTLGVASSKESNHPLCMKDIQVLNMSVRDRWNSKEISSVVEKSIASLYTRPSYIISDNDTKLKKAIQQLNTHHIADVGHTLALFLEKTYKEEEDFKEYMKKLSDLRFQQIMSPVAYLLPPSQRTVARFMNLRDVIKWSVKMKENIHRLAEEKQKFLFIREYCSLIDELDESFSLVDQINNSLKRKGLDKNIFLEELKRLQPFKARSLRQRKLAALIEDYLREQIGKLPKEDQKIHVSSDIIESLFSIYKRRKSPNPLNGVSASILLLPLLTKKTQYTQVDFKNALQGVSLAELERWKSNNLSENKARKRETILAA